MYNQFINSTKPRMIKTKTLLAKNLFLNEQNLVSNQSHTYNKYEQSLEANVKTIMIKYPSLDKKKIKDLLEELDNNR